MGGQDQLERYGFGKNWQRFLTTLNDQRIDSAKQALQDFLGEVDLNGKTFIDIGSGSGLSSYAAYLLGAKKIVSFDYDQFSVECTRYLHAKAGKPEHWTVQQGSALDKDFMQSLGQFDIVYSWGVLHHTGDMWSAIRNTTELVSPNGWLYISIYNKLDTMFGSEFWHRVKKTYNSSPRPVQLIMENIRASQFLLYYVLTGRNPIKEIRDYGKDSGRGMSWRRDISDWVGGYPYEAATVDEIFKFIRTEFPQFTLENIKSCNSLAINDFLFHSNTRSQSL